MEYYFGDDDMPAAAGSSSIAPAPEKPLRLPAADVFDKAVAGGVVRRSGSWFVFEDSNLGQSRDHAVAYLREDPSLVLELLAAINEAAFDDSAGTTAAALVPVAAPMRNETRVSLRHGGRPGLSGIQLREAFRSYLLGERNLTPSTALTYNVGLDRIETFLGMAAEVVREDPDAVRRFLRESPFHPSTKNSSLVALKAFDRWGVLDGHWSAGPLEALVGPKMVRNPKPSMSDEEARTLLQVARRPSEVRLVYLGLYAGLRVSEAASIGPDQWLSDRLRFLGKGRKMRDVPVHPELQAKRDLILSRETAAGSLKHTGRALSYATGVDFTSHTLRRTFASHLVQKRVPREVVGSILGHAPATVTEFAYAPVQWDEQLEAVLLADYGAPGAPSRPVVENSSRGLSSVIAPNIADGAYMAFDQEGRPWGVVNIGESEE